MWTTKRGGQIVDALGLLAVALLALARHGFAGTTLTLGATLLPLVAYGAFRLMGFCFPTPLFAALGIVLLLAREAVWRPVSVELVWGGALCVAALGLGYRAYSRGGKPWGIGAILGLAAAASPVMALGAGFGLSYFLCGSRRPARTLAFLLKAAVLAFAVAGYALLPRLVHLHDGPGKLLSAARPPAGLPASVVWPLLAVTVGIVGTLLTRGRVSGADHRLLFLGYTSAAAMALFCGLGGAGFIASGQLAACLCAAAALGLACERMPRVDLVALALFAAALVLGGRARPGTAEDTTVAVTRGAWDWSDTAGLALSLAGLAFVAVRAFADRRAAARPEEPRMPRALTPAVLEMWEPPPSPPRWGWAVPVGLLLALLAARMLLLENR